MPKRGIPLGEWSNKFGGRANGGTVRRSIPGVQGSNGTIGIAFSANQVRYYPMVVEHPIQVDQLSIFPTVAGAATTTARLGIYHADNEFQPTALAVDAGTVAVDTTGDKQLAISPAVLLTPGRYVMASNSDGAPNCKHIYTASLSWGGIPAAFSGSNLFIVNMRVNQTYAAFPDPGDAYSTVQAGSGGFYYGMFLRVAAL